MTHENYLQKHSLKCRLLPEETVHLFDGTGYPSFSKVVNTCVANCPTETVIIFSHKVYPFPDEIEKILTLLDQGYAFVGLCRFAFFGFNKELFRKIGFLDERFLAGSFEDEDFLRRIRMHDLAMYIGHESIYVEQSSGWRTQKFNNSLEKAKHHFDNKWTMIVDEKKDFRTLEEKYSYDLGLSTNQKFLSWNKTIVSVVRDKALLKIENYNINDKTLNSAPLAELPHVRKYIRLQKFKF